jgi:hypothetical protein
LAAYFYGRVEEYKLLNGGALPPAGALYDDGTFPWAVLTAWKLHGLPLEIDWPHDVARLNRDPSWKAVVEGHLHETSEFYGLDSKMAALLLDIETSVRADCPVMLTVPVDAEMVQWTGAVPLGPRTGKILGRHRLPILGITAAGEAIAVNSWSKGWGDGGLAYLTQEFVATQALNVTCVTARRM